MISENSKVCFDSFILSKDMTVMVSSIPNIVVVVLEVACEDVKILPRNEKLSLSQIDYSSRGVVNPKYMYVISAKSLQPITEPENFI